MGEGPAGSLRGLVFACVGMPMRLSVLSSMGFGRGVCLSFVRGDMFYMVGGRCCLGADEEAREESGGEGCNG